MTAPLNTTHATIIAEVGEYCGWSRSPSGNDLIRVNACLDAAQRRFYFHAKGADGRIHKWNFLRPVTSFVAWPDWSGNIDGNGTTTVDFDSDSDTCYATMVGRTLSVTDGEDYTITGYTDADTLVVDSTTEGEDADAACTIASGDYRMPNDFGGIDGVITASADDNVFEQIMVVSEQQIRHLRMQSTSRTGQPVYAAIRPVSAGDQTAAQKWDMLLWPEPDASYTLTFRYFVLPNKLLTGAEEYGWGDAKFSETLLEGCLAVAEERYRPDEGTHRQRYAELLADSVQLDSQTVVPEFLGYNANVEEGEPRYWRRTDTITYNNVSYP